MPKDADRRWLSSIGGDVSALQVLGDCHFLGLFLADIVDSGRNIHLVGQERGAVSALPVYDFVAVGFLKGAQTDGLQHSLLTYAVGKFAKGYIIELTARVERVGTDVGECHGCGGYSIC